MRFFIKRVGEIVKILIYGAGVIGSIFAGKLALSGNDITVLARNQRFDEMKSNGIILKNPKTNEKEQIFVNVIFELVSNDYYDYIFVVMQNTQVDEILPKLSQNCSTNIVFVVNTALGYEKWVQAVGKEKLMLCFPSAGGERKKGEVLYFVGHGIQRCFQTTTFGEYSGTKTQRVKDIMELFNFSKIPSVFCSNMDAWQKTHVALVTNIANALYGCNCDNYALGDSYNGVQEMVLGIKEARMVLRKCGIKPTHPKLWWIDLPTPAVSIGFGLFMRTQLARTTMAKHCLVAKQEMISLQKEFDILIEKSNIATPTIDTLKKNLYCTK